MAKRRKLKRGEHRYHKKIVKPKNYNEWKKNKFYDKHTKQWYDIEEKELIPTITKIPKKKEKIEKNKKIVVTLYQYETNDIHGRSLELDIVGHIILTKKEFDKIDNIELLMVSFIKNNLLANYYEGLATAISRADNYGIEISDTDEKPSDFVFDRFVINGVDYTNKIIIGSPRIKMNKKKDDKNEK